MVFGQPVYNTQQRRAALQQFKDYIDELRRKKNLPPWDVAIKAETDTETETEKVRKVRRRRRKRRVKRNNLPIKLRKRRMRVRRKRRRGKPMFAAILSDLKRKEKQRKRFLR